ncbi:MAG: rhodanese-like domain-containing protein [Segatella copri]
MRLDVRTAEEFANGHIRGAINIDVLKSDFEQKAAATLPKSKTIAVNCRSGKRSKNAAAILTKNGYQVIELDSGFIGWQAAGKEIVKE